MRFGSKPSKILLICLHSCTRSRVIEWALTFTEWSKATTWLLLYDEIARLSQTWALSLNIAKDFAHLVCIHKPFSLFVFIWILLFLFTALLIIIWLMVVKVSQGYGSFASLIFNALWNKTLSLHNFTFHHLNLIVNLFIRVFVQWTSRLLSRRHRPSFNEFFKLIIISFLSNNE